MDRGFGDLNPLERRLRTVEFRLRVTAAGWLVSLVLLGLAGIGAEQASSQLPTIRTRGVEVTDPSGRTRIVLDATGDAARITMLDAAGRGRLRIRLTNDGVPAIVGYDASGREYALIPGPGQTQPGGAPGGGSPGSKH